MGLEDVPSKMGTARGRNSCKPRQAIPHTRLTCEAKASLSSNTSMSSELNPAFSSACSSARKGQGHTVMGGQLQVGCSPAAAAVAPRRGEQVTCHALSVATLNSLTLTCLGDGQGWGGAHDLGRHAHLQHRGRQGRGAAQGESVAGSGGWWQHTAEKAAGQRQRQRQRRAAQRSRERPHRQARTVAKERSVAMTGRPRRSASRRVISSSAAAASVFCRQQWAHVRGKSRIRLACLLLRRGRQSP